MQRWIIVTTEDTQGVDDDGQPITIPAGTAVNQVLWDGISPWTPPEGTKAVPAE